MKMQLFAVRDKQLDAHMQLWCAQSIGQAVRMFTDEVNNPNGQIHAHPGDYDLYHLGEFDQETGTLTQDQYQPKQVAIGTNCHIKK